MRKIIFVIEFIYYVMSCHLIPFRGSRTLIPHWTTTSFERQTAISACPRYLPFLVLFLLLVQSKQCCRQGNERQQQEDTKQNRHDQ